MGLNIKNWCVWNRWHDDPLANAQLKSFNYVIFEFVNSDVKHENINSLDPTKKTRGAIPTKLVKLAINQICKDLGNCFNERLK